MNIKSLIGAAAIALVSAQASATIVNVDLSGSDGAHSGALNIGAASLSSSTGGFSVSGGIIDISGGTFRIDFSSAGVMTVFVDLFDSAGSAPVDGFLNAFDTGGAAVAVLAGSFGNQFGVQVANSGDDIGFVEFGGASAVGAGNISYDVSSAAAVSTPVPAALPLMARAFAGVAVWVRRRAKHK